jgi:transposase
VDDSITILLSGGIIMICVGIDVAKDKHDCFILSAEGEVLTDVFTIPNNRDGFETLLQRFVPALSLPTQ